MFRKEKECLRLAGPDNGKALFLFMETFICITCHFY